MNTMKKERLELLLHLLCEGVGINSAARITGVHKMTILRYLKIMGAKAKTVLAHTMHDLNPESVQIDEMWTKVKKSKRFIEKDSYEARIAGDRYIAFPIDRTTKLIPFFSVGRRSWQLAQEVLDRLRSVISPSCKTHITTDGWPQYRNATEKAFGADSSFVQLKKKMGPRVIEGERYGQPEVIEMYAIYSVGNPKEEQITTSHVERANLTMRTYIRRLARMNNGISKCVENLEAHLAIFLVYYNFIRVHEALRVTPAMEAGITKRLWTWADLLDWEPEQVAA